MENLKKEYHTPEKFLLEDDGVIPNSKYPLLIYHHVLSESGDKAADWLENTFNNHNWTNSWRWGVFDFHHYHSNTHEVLGVYQGNAKLLMGGEKGAVLEVKTGDVIIIPAGVGHKCLNHSVDFSVVGAYPNGVSADMNKGEPHERPLADEQIRQVPLPDTDPLQGKKGGLLEIWHS